MLKFPFIWIVFDSSIDLLYFPIPLLFSNDDNHNKYEGIMLFFFLQMYYYSHLKMDPSTV